MESTLNIDNAAILLKPKEMMTELVSPKNGKYFELDEMYDLLKCEMIQVVPLKAAGAFLVLDEEGRIKYDQGQNPEGYFYTSLFGEEVLCGRGLIVGTKGAEMTGTHLGIRDVAPYIRWMASD